MHRFFVSPEDLAQTPVELRGDLAHQIGRVLRCRPGDQIILLDGTGRAVRAQICSMAASLVTADILDVSLPHTEPRVAVVLYAALPKGKHFEWVLQKGTEVGVAAFAPMITERCALPNADEVNAARAERWRRIVTEAAEQSGRARIPDVWPVRPFAEVCVAPPEGVLALIPWVDASAMSLRATLAQWRSQARGLPREVRVYIGPEGDFAASEIQLARERGIRPVSLGPRILRAETAAVVTPALILYDLGEMEPAAQGSVEPGDAPQQGSS